MNVFCFSTDLSDSTPKLSIQSFDLEERTVAILRLLLPPKKKQEQLLLHPGISVRVSGAFLEAVNKHGGGREGFGKGTRVFGEGFQQGKSAKLPVSRPIPGQEEWVMSARKRDEKEMKMKGGRRQGSERRSRC